MPTNSIRGTWLLDERGVFNEFCFGFVDLGLTGVLFLELELESFFMDDTFSDNSVRLMDGLVMSSLVLV